MYSLLYQFGVYINLIIMGQKIKDSFHKTIRQKQIAFWNLNTLNHIHSLSTMIQHHPYPQLHSEHDRNWSSLFLMDVYRPNGQPKPETFISRSIKYLSQNANSTLDRISMFKTKQYKLIQIKNEFWTRLYHLKPTSKQNYQCRRIVRNIVWKERIWPYFTALIAGTVVNALSGITKLNWNKKASIYVLMGIFSQILVRVKKSDKIFYQIPELPSQELEAQRKKIVQQCLVFDGVINTYGKMGQIDQILFRQAIIDYNTDNEVEKENQVNEESVKKWKEKEIQNEKNRLQVLQAIGFNVIQNEDDKIY